MKHTFKYILSTVVLLVPVLALAQTMQDPPIYSDYKIENGVATAKSVTSTGNNLYTLTLETFATGISTIVDTSTPVDVVLVLDVSRSMSDNNYSYYNEEEGRQVTESRLNALKYAVGKFIKEIARNDAYHDDNTPRGHVLGNRIQIITFSTQAATQACFTEFQPAAEKEETILAALNGDAFTPRTATFTNQGMLLGRNWTQTSYNEKPGSNRVVVMFTDGCPTNSMPTSFNGSMARDAVNYAYTMKQSYGATVYSIGLITWSDLSTQNQANVRNMMDYISSNYPDGQATYSGGNFRCTGTRVDTQYNFYVDANETDLGKIFSDVAHASGGSESSIPGETQLVDEVSSSFEVPSTFKASDVVIFYRSINAAGTEWVGSASTTPLTVVPLDADYDLENPPSDDESFMQDENKVGVYLHGGQLVILGFNYSKEDSEGTDGSTAHPYDGNWVGWRDVNKCAGKELVVQFSIEAIDDVTGGDNTNTNTTKSGVYVPVYDENHVFQGYAPATKYPYPDTDLPINIVIQKDGLRRGESATIQIYRAAQKPGVYNTATGKPAPDVDEDGNGWENFSKVILTNKGDDGDSVVKTLLSLDPAYVYKLEEDNWGFGYILDDKSIDTSEQVSNPFVFTNNLKVTPEDWADGGEPRTPVKHAEAVSINHFGSGAHAETLKGTKGFN